MHVAYREEYLTDIEHGDIIAEATVLSESVKELSSRTKLKYHIDKSIVLEGCLKRIYERMVQLTQYFLLQLNVLDLFEINYVGLGYLFESKHLLVRPDHLLHPSKGTCTQCLSHFVFGDVIRVSLGQVAFGFGGRPIRLVFERKTDLFPFSFSL